MRQNPSTKITPYYIYSSRNFIKLYVHEKADWKEGKVTDRGAKEKTDELKKKVKIFAHLFKNI